MTLSSRRKSLQRFLLESMQFNKSYVFLPTCDALLIKKSLIAKTGTPDQKVARADHVGVTTVYMQKYKTCETQRYIQYLHSSTGKTILGSTTLPLAHFYTYPYFTRTATWIYTQLNSRHNIIMTTLYTIFGPRQYYKSGR